MPDDLQPGILTQAIGGNDPTLQAYTPSWRERLGGWLFDQTSGSPIARHAVEGLVGSSGLGNSGMSIADFVPGVGQVLAGQEAANGGDYKGAALALVPIPGANKIAPEINAAKKNIRLFPVSYDQLQTDGALASRSASIYNPTEKAPRAFPVKVPRAFEVDYPGGAIADADGKLALDMDGRPLAARYVAGRIADGGSDMALPREALDEIAKAGTGSGIFKVPPSTLGRSVGSTQVNKYSRQPTEVAVSEKLDPQKYDLVASHEIGSRRKNRSGKRNWPEFPTH